MRQHRLLILVWVFMSMLTGCDKDDNPPRIISFTPRTGSQGEVLVTDQRRGDASSPLIKAQFNEALLPSSIPANALILEYNGVALPGISDFAPQINTVSFEPAEQLLFMRQYDVTLKTGIADLEGNRDTKGKEWSFRVRDGSFSSTITLESNAGAVTNPQISIGAGFDAQFIWTQVTQVDHDNDGSTPSPAIPTPTVPRSSIWARTLEVNLLESPVLIEDDYARLDANSPQIAVDAEGYATAVWSQFDGSNWRIRANRFTPDDKEQPSDSNVSGTWGPTEPVTITIASPGIVNWTAHGLTNDRKVVLNTTGSLPTGLTAGTTYYVRNATADSFELSATSTSGSAGTSINISGTQSGIHTATAIAFSEIISDAGSDATVPQIAVGPDGNPIAVWVQADGRVYANRYTGSWGSATAIDANTGTPTTPQIVIDGGNNAIAVWSQSDGTRTNIWTNRFSNGSWGTPALLETDNAGDAVTPRIAVDPDTDDGNAIVVWSQSDGTRANIRANRFNGTAWDGAITIENNNENDANTPQIAMNAAGTAVAIWSQSLDIDVPPTVVPITIASPGVVSWTAHGLANNRRVILETTGSLPTGLTAGTTYYVRNATADSFELSATPGGASINTSGTQSGTHTATAVPRFRIYSSFFEAGGDWLDTPDGDWAPVTIDNFDPEIYVPAIFEQGVSTEPQIAIDGDGNTLAVWTIDSGGETTLIGVNRYRGPAAHEDIRGWAEAAIFEASTATAGDYDTPKVAMFPDLTAVAVWEKDNETTKAATITIASPGVVNCTAHALANDHAVVLATNGTLPTGLTAGTTYYVRNPTANSFELSATPGGVSIDTSGTQTGTHSATAFVASIQSNYFF